VGRVLVTGATGFTGSALSRRLRDEGEEVVAFVRPSSRVVALEAMGVECRAVDITRKGAVDASFEPFDRVFHIAAAYRTEHASRDEFRRVNVEATRHLLEAARGVGVGRFVHCSTVGVQGKIDDPPADEDYRLKPGDHYQQTKLEGEQLARAAFADGLPGVVVRPVGVYGPGDVRFLKLFRPIQRGYFVMIGTGRTLYHLTYIDDLIDGFLLASRREEALGGVFTVAGKQYTTIGELVELIANVLGTRQPRWRVPFAPVYAASVGCEEVCRVLGIAPPLYRRRVEFFQFDRAFAIDRARRVLGYEPKVGLRDGLARTGEWYRREGLL
jgi:nucleoside-diphosphate-sugar epimerase